MTAPEDIMARIGEGIGLGRRGKRSAARSLFTDLWIEIGGDDGDPLHRCGLAHSMADVQDDVAEELRWDLVALAAADSISDERLGAAGIDGGAAGFYPSLHLNLGECYRKLGRLDEAREHLDRGVAALSALPDGGYPDMIRAGLIGLADRIGRSPLPRS